MKFSSFKVTLPLGSLKTIMQHAFIASLPRAFVTSLPRTLIVLLFHMLHCCLATSSPHYLATSFTLPHFLFCVASSCYLFTSLRYIVTSSHSFATSLPCFITIARCLVASRYLLTPSFVASLPCALLPHYLATSLLCWLVLPSFFCRGEFGAWRSEFSSNH
jgi:hypothetical protein